MVENETTNNGDPVYTPSDSRRSYFLSGVAKYSGMLLIVLFAVGLLWKKFKNITWSDFVHGLQTIPSSQIALAVAVTVLNFVVLTGYDLMAVRYLKKTLSVRKVMMGAIIGYSMSNVFGWIIGGTALRYRLYSRWGFSLIEVVAFVSFLSVTFWTGMFLLAGISFVMLPVELPEQYRHALYFSPKVYGWVFLTGVGLYLGASAFYRKPFKIGANEYRLPPLGLSLMQLLVSAADFALASFVLYLLLPTDCATYPTVLVAYMAGMVVTVTLHVPGGIGVLDAILLYLLDPSGDDGNTSPMKISVACAIVIFRIIYYLLPALVSGALLFYHEISFKSVPPKLQPGTN